MQAEPQKDIRKGKNGSEENKAIVTGDSDDLASDEIRLNVGTIGNHNAQSNK
jgi:hypothetical protein